MSKDSAVLKENTLINEIDGCPLIHKRSNNKAVNLNSIYAMTKDTDYKVRGQFVNIEYPGQPQKVCGKYYKGMPYFAQTLEDGVTVDIPYSVARYINEDFAYEEHSNLQDAKGNYIKTGKKKPRGKFIIEQHLK